MSISRARRTPAGRSSGAGVALAAPASKTPREIELEAALEKERRIGAVLREVGVALGTTLDLDKVLELVLGKITEALEADRATLYLLDETRGELVSRIVHGEEVRSIHMKVGEGIAGAVAKSGKPLHVNDAYKDPRFSREWDELSGYRTRGILAAPLKNHIGTTIGVIQVLNKRHGDFDADDAELLAALSTHAAVSIDKTRLFVATLQKNHQLLETKGALERRVRDLRLLFSLESAMARAATIEELFIAVLGEAMRAGEARAAAVALRDRATRLISVFIVDDKHTRMRRFPLAEGQGLIGASMRDKVVVQTAEAERDPRTDAALDRQTGFECLNALAVPLEGEEGESIGAIALYNKRSRSGFGRDDLELVQLIAANASTAIRLQEARIAREHEDRLTTIGRLLSGVIHDFKTPLTVISGYVQLMQSESSAARREAYARSVLKQFDHISAMQREVLEFARGERSILLSRVLLPAFFEDVRAQLEPQLSRLGISFVINLRDHGAARFDADKMLRVVNNLARNAQEAMAARGGVFTIDVGRAKGRAGDELTLCFSDTGPGIPREIEHRLFQSFVTSGKQGGTGLGLAIVKKIVDDHGGHVSVRSTKAGATFEIRLPQPELGGTRSSVPRRKAARPATPERRGR